MHTYSANLVKSYPRKSTPAHKNMNNFFKKKCISGQSVDYQRAVECVCEDLIHVRTVFELSPSGTRFTIHNEISRWPNPSLCDARFGALITRAEKSKTCSISSETSAADAAGSAASTAEVLEEIEHVFEFSARVKAQIVVTRHHMAEITVSLYRFHCQDELQDLRLWQKWI